MADDRTLGKTTQRALIGAGIAAAAGTAAFLLARRSPDVHDAVDEAERAREGAAASRSAAEAQRSELARIVASQRQGVLQLQGEMAVAEERQRNALSRRQRAEQVLDVRLVAGAMPAQDVGVDHDERLAHAAASS